jgi:hypothetical protein
MMLDSFMKIQPEEIPISMSIRRTNYMNLPYIVAGGHKCVPFLPSSLLVAK